MVRRDWGEKGKRGISTWFPGGGGRDTISFHIAKLPVRSITREKSGKSIHRGKRREKIRFILSPEWGSRGR